MSVFEMAKQYYPRLWSEERILALEQAGRLTRQEAEEIVGHAVQLPAPAPDNIVDKLAAAYLEGVDAS